MNLLNWGTVRIHLKKPSPRATAYYFYLLGVLFAAGAAAVLTASQI
jgi:hypothetical protein